MFPEGCALFSLGPDTRSPPADKGHLDCVEALVDAGVDLNSFKDSKGRTILMRVSFLTLALSRCGSPSRD